MILTLIALISAVVGITIVVLDEHDIINIGDILYGLTGVMTFFGIIFTFAFSIAILMSHVGTDVTMEKERIERESLVLKLQKVDEFNGAIDEKEINMSISTKAAYMDVVDDIAKWNKHVVSSQYWAKNPWTSWFYNQKVVNARELIDIK